MSLIGTTSIGIHIMAKKRPHKPDILDRIIARAEGRNDYTPEPEPEPKPVLEKALIKKNPDALQRLEHAYIRMGITAEAVESYPVISSLFNDIGGVPAVMEYLRASHIPEAREMIRYWDMYGDSEDGIKELIPFEAYCVAAKCTKKRVLQLIMGEICEQSDMASILMAAAAHPDVLKKTIEVAKSDLYGSSEARKILHQNRGFLPTPKTQNVNIHGNLNQDNRQDNRQIANVSLSELDLMGEKISKSVDRFNESRIIDVDDEPIIDVDQ